MEPVKPTLRTMGFEVSSPPIAGRILGVAGDDAENALAGDRRASASSATASADSGVCSAGLSTIVQPTASGGADLRVTIADGKFHGVIPPQTPIGCLVTRIRLSRCGEGIVSP